MKSKKWRIKKCISQRWNTIKQKELTEEAIRSKSDAHNFMLNRDILYQN